MTSQSPLPLVLVADDDPDDLVLLNEAFAETGVAVRLETVTDGAELLDFLCADGPVSPQPDDLRPALVICDINMPRVDGFDALSRLRAVEGFANLPVVMFTSSSSEADRARSLKSGASEHIVKPSSFD